MSESTAERVLRCAQRGDHVELTKLLDAEPELVHAVDEDGKHYTPTLCHADGPFGCNNNTIYVQMDALVQPARPRMWQTHGT